MERTLQDRENGCFRRPGHVREDTQEKTLSRKSLVLTTPAGAGPIRSFRNSTSCRVAFGTLVKRTPKFSGLLADGERPSIPSFDFIRPRHRLFQCNLLHRLPVSLFSG